MEVDQMLHHLNLACGGSLGFYNLPDEGYLTSRTFFKWILVDWFPEQPVGLRLPAGFKIPHSQRFEFACEKAQLLKILGAAWNARTAEAWKAHPMFGKMTSKEWGKLSQIHVDYHLRRSQLNGVFAMKVLILGATGLVGRNALAQALAQPAVTQVIAPTRRPLTKQDKLMNPVAPKLELLLPEVASWGSDAAICATGTTIKKAGSKEAFRSVDHDLPLSFARLAHQAGTQNFALVSSTGASVESSFFYAMVKGELERDVREIGFRSLTILRPGLIGGGRDEFRLAESLALRLSHFLAPVLPKRFHVNPAAKIAQVLVDAAVTGEPGCHFRYSDSLV
jgi:uncharacterized protein YbjT (DUF2867 family)